MSPAVVALSWPTAVWSGCAAACLTLAAVYLYIGLIRRAPDDLAFALSAVSVAVMAAFELALQRSATPAEYGRILQGAHVALFFLIASVIFFVRAYLKAGRPWLGWTVIGLRGAALAVNFLRPPNFNFTRIDALREVPLMGDVAAVPIGVLSPWTRLGQLISTLLFVFVADAAWMVWRRGERRRAALIGGTMIFFIAFASLHTALVHGGVLRSPYVISFAFLPVVAAMWYELTRDVLSLPELERDLREKDEALHETETRLTLAAEAARFSVWVWDVQRDRLHVPGPARRLRGYGDTEPIDLRKFLWTVHPDDRQGVERSIRDSLDAPGPFEREYRVILPGGATRWMTAIGVVESDADGNATCVRGVSIDVTERRLAQLESEKNRDELAHLARFTTLGELSGSLAHEL